MRGNSEQHLEPPASVFQQQERARAEQILGNLKERVSQMERTLSSSEGATDESAGVRT